MLKNCGIWPNEISGPVSQKQIRLRSKYSGSVSSPHSSPSILKLCTVGHRTFCMWSGTLGREQRNWNLDEKMFDGKVKKSVHKK